jgi:uncharacterized membrane protein YobD (UPF0266 family)
MPESEVQRRLVGTELGPLGERNGYIFWGLVALFIGIPEVLAALSNTLKARIPWPTISNLVGKHLEARHHWIALIVMGVIVLVIYQALTRRPDRTRVGRQLSRPADTTTTWDWGGWYIVLVVVSGIAAGVIAAAFDAGKVVLGYAIYVTLAVTGIAIPGALAYWWGKVLNIPTLFATFAFLQRRAAWAAAILVALLVILLFHLALYPWPNYRFGGPA